MRDSVRAAFVTFNVTFEGSVPWMYLDIKGLVTVAIGNLIDPIAYARSLPFVDETGAPAATTKIAREWNLVKAGGCGKYDDPRKCAWTKGKCFAHAGHLSTKPVTRLRLTPEGVDMVVTRKRDEMAAALRKRFTHFDCWPANAQLAVLSMAWALGPAFRYPKLAAALELWDWKTAEAECHIRETDNPGVKPRNVANKALFAAAAAGGDPDSIGYPVAA